MALRKEIQNNVNLTFAEFVELKTRKDELEARIKVLGEEIREALESGQEVRALGKEAYLCEATTYIWDPTAFRRAYPGLWIECATIDGAKATAFLKAGRIKAETVHEIREPKTTTQLRTRKAN